MTKSKANIDGYAISSQLKKILKEEGFVAVRVIDNKNKNDNLDEIKICEAWPIKTGSVLPNGTDTVLSKEQIRDYETIIIIEEDFKECCNTKNCNTKNQE